MKSCAFLIGLGLGSLLLESTCFAHPRHVCIGEVEIVLEKQENRIVLETAILIRSVDLASAISPGQIIDLESRQAQTEVDKTIIQYLSEHFVVRAGTKALPLEWVGREPQKSNYWLYFTFQAEAESIENIEITNTLLMDLEPDQVNSLLVKQGKTKWSLSFTQQDQTKRLRDDRLQRASRRENGE